MVVVVFLLLFFKIVVLQRHGKLPEKKRKLKFIKPVAKTIGLLKQPRTHLSHDDEDY